MGWSQSQLAAEAGLSIPVIQAFESGHRDPSQASLKIIRAHLIVAGIIFVDEEDGFGVKLRAISEQARSVVDYTEMPLITNVQARAARALLNLTQSEAAASLNVGLSMVKNFELGISTPHPKNLRKIRNAYEQMGVRFFLDGNRVAVSFMQSSATQIGTQ